MATKKLDKNVEINDGKKGADGADGAASAKKSGASAADKKSAEKSGADSAKNRPRARKSGAKKSETNLNFGGADSANSNLDASGADGENITQTAPHAVIASEQRTTRRKPKHPSASAAIQNSNLNNANDKNGGADGANSNLDVGGANGENNSSGANSNLDNGAANNANNNGENNASGANNGDNATPPTLPTPPKKPRPTSRRPSQNATSSKIPRAKATATAELNEVGFFVEDDFFIYPFMIVPLFVKDAANRAAVEFATEHKTQLFVAMAREGKEGVRGDASGVFQMGVLGNIIRVAPLPNGMLKVLFQGKKRARLEQILAPHTADVSVVASTISDEKECDALAISLKKEIKKLAETTEEIPGEIIRAIENSDDAERVCDFVLNIIKPAKARAYELFAQRDLNARLFGALECVRDEIASEKLQSEIREKVGDKINKQNKNYFLKEQIKELRRELGEASAADDELDGYRERFDALRKMMPPEAQREVEKQLRRLSHTHADSSEANVITTWLDYVFDLPFACGKDSGAGFADVARTLDADHYGLEKPKARIVEYFALREFAKARRDELINKSLDLFADEFGLNDGAGAAGEPNSNLAGSGGKNGAGSGENCAAKNDAAKGAKIPAKLEGDIAEHMAVSTTPELIDVFAAKPREFVLRLIEFQNEILERENCAQLSADAAFADKVVGEITPEMIDVFAEDPAEFMLKIIHVENEILGRENRQNSREDAEENAGEKSSENAGENSHENGEDIFEDHIEISPEFTKTMGKYESRIDKIKGDRGTILCFVGAPGVGKTSLANSIAHALGRKLVRIALGGVEDSNELRGHRRTYVGAMPGRVAAGLIEAGEANPVIVLDEIDKLAKSYHGDPAAVLLEILDPEQNTKFRDHYLNFPIDLSRAVFVATANDAGAILPALRDRMEMIEINSYTPQEKFFIATRHLIPQECARCGFAEGEVAFDDDAVREIIEHYTRESGVRGLRKQIAKILRKCAMQALSSGAAGANSAGESGADFGGAGESGVAGANSNLSAAAAQIRITKDVAEKMLEKRVFDSEAVLGEDAVGVVNGLGWTSAGGLILKIEAIKLRGKGGLQLTGQIGDVMKESGQISLSLARLLFDEGVVSAAGAGGAGGVIGVAGAGGAGGAANAGKSGGEDGANSNLAHNAGENPAHNAGENAHGGENAAQNLAQNPAQTPVTIAADEPFYNKFDICLHIPEGAMQKDGPSAGIAMTTAFVSVLSGRKVRRDVAMTGEITLSGRVLAIGGLKEKLIAAFKAGAKTALIPRKNFERDLDELPREVRDALDIIAVDNIKDVLRLALV